MMHSYLLSISATTLDEGCIESPLNESYDFALAFLCILLLQCTKKRRSKRHFQTTL